MHSRRRCPCTSPVHALRLVPRACMDVCIPESSVGRPLFVSRLVSSRLTNPSLPTSHHQPSTRSSRCATRASTHTSGPSAWGPSGDGRRRRRHPWSWRRPRRHDLYGFFLAGGVGGGEMGGMCTEDNEQTNKQAGAGCRRPLSSKVLFSFHSCM